MPARREMFTGRYNFLEAPWGPIEPWDVCMPPELTRQKGTYSHCITDHYHYFHSGGEGYHTLFSSWEFERGQEGDVWRPMVQDPPVPETRGKGSTRRAYWANRSCMDTEMDEEYPTPRCFMRAMEFLDRNHDVENWHLHLEVFDPHEPFDSPASYRELYGDTWDGYLYNWPQYDRLDPELDDQEAVLHVRRRYAGALTMADHWLGKFLDKMDTYKMWDDTVIILTTDHGHLLGEHGYWAKNYMFEYSELVNIPLIVCAPGVEAGARRSRALTATIDLMPTIMEFHGAAIPGRVHGKSLKPMVEKDKPHHDAVLYGYFGKDVGMTDGKYTYCRQPAEDSILYHYTCMPRGFRDFIPKETLERADYGRFLPSAGEIPHMKIPQRSKRHVDAPDFNPIYDIKEDPLQEQPIHDKALEHRLSTQMRELLTRYEAPACQFDRLGFGSTRESRPG